MGARRWLGGVITAGGVLALVAGSAGYGSGDSGGPVTSVGRTLGIDLPNGVVVAPAGASTTAAATNILTYDYGNFRDGVEPGGPSLLHLSQQSVRDRDLKAAVYGQPLVDGSLVVVAAENDEVYGLGAGTGATRWKVSIGQPVSLATIHAAGLAESCGNIDPLGITGTPVIDPALKEVFVAGEVLKPGFTPSWEGIQHVMAAISLGGKLLWERRIDPPGAGSVYQVPAEQQRPAMTLANGRLYTFFGGLSGDCGSYQGYAVSLPESGKGSLAHFKVPTTREGAIWSVGGASVDAKGDLFVAIGNSADGPGQPFDYGDSVIELSPVLTMEGYFAPSGWALRNAYDLDLGSDGPTILPGGSVVFQTGKHTRTASRKDVGYLLTAGHLGGIGHARFDTSVCPNGDGAWGANAAASVKVSGATTTYVYVPCQTGTVALTVNRTGTGFRDVWQASTGAPNGPPIVAGGLVWALNIDSSTLYGMQTTTGRVAVQRSVDPVEHFAAPSAADGMLFVPTEEGIEAFKPA